MKRSPQRHSSWYTVALGLLLCLAGTPARPEAATPPDLIARQLVSAALGVPLQSTRVVSSTPREFVDASLDCPAPGMAYAQVLTPGHAVIVEADGRRFDVRVAGNSGLICYRRKGGPAATSLPRPDPARLAETARQDLAHRLAAEPAEIQVMNVRGLTAGERAPGCGEVCSTGTARCGYGIRLLWDGRAFDYVSDGDGVRPCPDIASR